MGDDGLAEDLRVVAVVRQRDALVDHAPHDRVGVDGVAQLELDVDDAVAIRE